MTLKTLQSTAIVLALIIWIFDITAATGPWMASDANSIKVTVGLLSGTVCYNSNCVTTKYDSGDSTFNGFRAAAACLILGFIGSVVLFLMMISTLFGVQGMPIKISAVTFAAWTLVWTFLGCVIGGSKMHDLFPAQGDLKTSAGLPLSIIAVILSTALFIILFWAIPHANAEAQESPKPTIAAAAADAPKAEAASSASAV